MDNQNQSPKQELTPQDITALMQAASMQANVPRSRYGKKTLIVFIIFMIVLCTVSYAGMKWMTNN